MTSKQRRSHVNFPLKNNKGEVNDGTRYTPVLSLSNCGNLRASTGAEYRFGLFAFFCFLPSVKSYRRTLKAIEKLKIREYEFTDMRTRLLSGKASITKEDDGYDDLVNLLVINRWLGSKEAKEADELILREQEITRNLPFPDARFQWLNIRRGKQETAVMFPLGITQSPLHEITDLAEKNVRRDIANISGILMIIWLVIMTIMICLNISQ
jgi:hypothetical protein